VKRLPFVLLLVSVLVGLGTGCGDDDESADDPDTPVTAGPGDGGGQPPGDGGPVLVGPTPGLDGVVAVAIDSAELVAEDKLEVAFYNGILECYGVDRVEVLETDTEVTVSVFTGSLPLDGDVACIDIAQLQAVAVTLDAPLGDRRLIDGSSGTEVPVS
jgi:hypothetical protein